MHRKCDTGNDTGNVPEERQPLPQQAAQPGGSTEGFVRGRYLAAFEVSSFQPDGSTERWWTSFHDHLADEARELVDAARGTPIEVELAGELSDLGEFGHMGLYSRELRVHAIRRKSK
ncbi:MAG TPA: hypothetical protein VIH05_11495 [Tepidiformaceae bacterium]